METSRSSQRQSSLRPFLLQLSGIPGTGKSTLADSLAAVTGAVVIDKDDVMDEMGVDRPANAEVTEQVYRRVFELADEHLAQGRPVIISSPSYRPYIPQLGVESAQRNDAVYGFLELRVTDRDVLQHRLDTRPTRNFRANDDLLQESERPADVRAGLIDTTHLTPQQVLNEAVDYLRSRRAEERLAAGSTNTALDMALDRHLEDVRTRVYRGGDYYNHEISDAEEAVTQMRLRHRELDLGDFVEALNGWGKPQALFRFTGRSGEADDVLKVYGRERPGEGFVQETATRMGMLVWPTLRYGDAPTSWLLMKYVEGRDLTVDLEGADLATVAGITTKLAATMRGISTSVPHTFPGARSLEEGILMHLDTVVKPLRAHGYEVPDDYREHAIQAYNSGGKLPLSGDLFGGNARVDVRERLLVGDICAYIGPLEFDAARWLVRGGTPETFPELTAAWKRGNPDIDQRVFRGNLAAEVLMQAGVIEIVKDEQGLPWTERDPKTLALLADYQNQRALEDAAPRATGRYRRSTSGLWRPAGRDAEVVRPAAAPRRPSRPSDTSAAPRRPSRPSDTAVRRPSDTAVRRPTRP